MSKFDDAMLGVELYRLQFCHDIAELACDWFRQGNRNPEDLAKELLDACEGFEANARNLRQMTCVELIEAVESVCDEDTSDRIKLELIRLGYGELDEETDGNP